MSKTIGIDVYAALHSPRGMGNYVINFLKHIAQIDNGNKYILYGDIDDINDVLPKQNNFIFKKLNAKGLFHYEQFVLPKQAKKDNIDILHSPANTSPIFLDKNIKRFLTLHDVIFLKIEIPLPKNKRQLIGRLYYILTTLLNTHKAKVIFTPTEFSKNDIATTLKINKEKIVITPNGHEHFNIENATSIEELKQKYDIYNNYFFTLGGEAPSKNSEILLKIFAENKDINLVFAGIRNLENSILYNRYKNCKNIKFVPYIEQFDLVGIYKNAQAFIFPSLYEGFGIPLLEAMKCNCPIICSNASCIPEVAGEAALYFNPKNEEEIVSIIKNYQQVFNLDKVKLQLDKFTWGNTAYIINEVYNR